MLASGKRKEELFKKSFEQIKESRKESRKKTFEGTLWRRLILHKYLKLSEPKFPLPKLYFKSGPQLRSNEIDTCILT